MGHGASKEGDDKKPEKKDKTKNAKNGKKADEEEEYNEPEEPKNVQHNVPTIHADDENDEPRTGLRPPMDNVSTAHSYERSTAEPRYTREQHEAATVIQAHARGFLAREKVKAMPTPQPRSQFDDRSPERKTQTKRRSSEDGGKSTRNKSVKRRDQSEDKSRRGQSDDRSRRDTRRETRSDQSKPKLRAVHARSAYSENDDDYDNYEPRDSRRSYSNRDRSERDTRGAKYDIERIARSEDDAPDYHEAATTIQRAVRSYLGRRKFMEIFEPSETYAPIRDQRDVQATAWGDLQDRKGSLRAPDQAALRASDQGGRRSFDQRTTVRPVRTTTNDLDFLNDSYGDERQRYERYEEDTGGTLDRYNQSPPRNTPMPIKRREQKVAPKIQTRAHGYRMQAEKKNRRGNRDDSDRRKERDDSREDRPHENRRDDKRDDRREPNQRERKPPPAPSSKAVPSLSKLEKPVAQSHVHPTARLPDGALRPTWSEAPEVKQYQHLPARVAENKTAIANRGKAPPPQWKGAPGKGNDNKYQSDFIADFYW